MSFAPWLEIGVALGVAAAYWIASFFVFKPEHLQPKPAQVRAGALVHGGALGLLIGFVILPVRLALLDQQHAMSVPGAIASLSIAPAFLMMIAIRHGALLNIPGLARYTRAYRRANLLKTTEACQKQLARLDALEGGQA